MAKPVLVQWEKDFYKWMCDNCVIKDNCPGMCTMRHVFKNKIQEEIKEALEKTYMGYGVSDILKDMNIK